MELHVRHVLEHSKRQGNLGLRGGGGGAMELCLKGGLLGVRQTLLGRKPLAVAIDPG